MREIYTLYRLARADWRVLLLIGGALMAIWGYFAVNDWMKVRQYAVLSDLGAPAPSTYSAFTADDTGAPLTEVNISGLAVPGREVIVEYRSDGRVLTRTLYYPIFEPGAPSDPVTTLVKVPAGRAEKLDKMLAAGRAGGEVTVGGMRTTTAEEAEVQAALAKAGLTLAPGALYITPFLDGRSAFFAEMTREGALPLVLILGTVIGSLGLAKLVRDLSSPFLPRHDEPANDFVRQVTVLAPDGKRRLSTPTTAVVFGAIFFGAAKISQEETLISISQVIVAVMLISAVMFNQGKSALVTLTRPVTFKPTPPKESTRRFNVLDVTIPPPPTAEELRQEQKRLRPDPRPIVAEPVKARPTDFADSPIKTSKGWFR